jgi:hypothetical protein
VSSAFGFHLGGFQVWIFSAPTPPFYRLTPGPNSGVHLKKPFGYIYDHRLRNIVPDRKTAKIVQIAFEEYAAELHSLHSIAARLFELGAKSRNGRPWSDSAVYYFLTNRLYVGVMKWKDEIFEGKFKPLVSPEVFARVQQVLKKKERPRKFRSGHNFPLHMRGDDFSAMGKGPRRALPLLPLHAKIRPVCGAVCAGGIREAAVFGNAASSRNHRRGSSLLAPSD